MTRRRWLGAFAAAPLAAASAVEARDYRAAVEVRGEIERLTAVVELRLAAICSTPAGRAFAASARADLARHRRERREVLGDAGRTAAAAPAPEAPAALAALRDDLTALMHAHAEGLPALDDTRAVERLAAHMVDLSRIVTVVDLWIEGEDRDE